MIPVYASSCHPHATQDLSGPVKPQPGMTTCTTPGLIFCRTSKPKPSHPKTPELKLSTTTSDFATSCSNSSFPWGLRRLRVQPSFARFIHACTAASRSLLGIVPRSEEHTSELQSRVDI